MENFRRQIQNNLQRDVCVEHYKKGTLQVNPSESLWGGGIRRLNPPKLITAWKTLTDPLVIVAGQTYVSTVVRDTSFELQQRALETIRGVRKLTKGKMSEALSSLKPTEDQTKIIAMVLYHLHKVQTVSYDLNAKKIWTVPEDIREWSSTATTLWVDSRCETVLDFSDYTANPLSFGKWIQDMEDEGWTIPWPIADGTFEELKEAISQRNIIVKSLEFGSKPKKEDWARTLGRSEAIEHLLLNI